MDLATDASRPPAQGYARGSEITRAPNGRFIKGGGTGRKPGAIATNTREVRDFCRTIIADPEYRKSLRKRLIAGEASQAEINAVWHYALGKPPETIKVEGEERPPLVFMLHHRPGEYDPLAEAKPIGLAATVTEEAEPVEPEDPDRPQPVYGL